MDRVSICWNGKTYGELTMRGESLHTWFHARCRLPSAGIWAVWAVGERGELRIGIPEPCGEEAELRRRFSQRMTAPAGRLLRSELRPITTDTAAAWEPAGNACWQNLWLREKLLKDREALTCHAGECRLLAFPYSGQEPFPLVPLFCFAQFRHMDGKRYVVFLFDREERPRFPGADAKQNCKS